MGEGKKKEAYEAGALIPLLQEAQDRLGFLPRQELESLAKTLQIPFSTVYGVATFYSQFRLTPKGKHLIRTCSGTACHVRGAKEITKIVADVLKVTPGGTTEDGRFSWEEVACIGACGLAPVLMIDDTTFGRLTKDKVQTLLDEFSRGAKP